tara:strand:- start:17 stop:484 length:468 start_codon:yes stop_codon:yes gene_type:complete
MVVVAGMMEPRTVIGNAPLTVVMMLMVGIVMTMKIIPSTVMMMLMVRDGMRTISVVVVGVVHGVEQKLASVVILRQNLLGGLHMETNQVMVENLLIKLVATLSALLMEHVVIIGLIGITVQIVVIHMTQLAILIVIVVIHAILQGGMTLCVIVVI